MSGNTPAPPRVPRPLVELKARWSVMEPEGYALFNPEFERLARVHRLDLLTDWMFLLKAHYAAILDDREGSWGERPDARSVRLTVERAEHMQRAREERGIAGKTMPAGLPEPDDD